MASWRAKNEKATGCRLSTGLSLTPRHVSYFCRRQRQVQKEKNDRKWSNRASMYEPTESACLLLVPCLKHPWSFLAPSWREAYSFIAIRSLILGSGAKPKNLSPTCEERNSTPTGQPAPQNHPAKQLRESSLPARSSTQHPHPLTNIDYIFHPIQLQEANNLAKVSR